MKYLLTYHTKKGSSSVTAIEGELTLGAMQKAVGGYIQTCAPYYPWELAKHNINMLCDEEGLLKGLEPNENLYPFFYVGNVVFVGVKGEEFVGLTTVQIAMVRKWVQSLEASI